MKSRIFQIACIVVAQCAVFGLAHAEPAADKSLQRAQEQVRRLRQQMQTLQQSADKAVQDTTQLGSQLKQSDEALALARKKGQDLAHRMVEAEQKLQTQSEEQAQLSRKLTEALAQVETLRKQSAGLQEQLSARETTLSLQDVRLKAESVERQRCESNNQALYSYGRELLEAYRNKGVISAISQRDPVFNIGSVKIENILEEYRDKLDEKRLSQEKSKDAVPPEK